MGARHYDSSLGRWVSPDTLVPNPQNPQSLNRFSYTRNNPVKYPDPSGHAEIYGDSYEPYSDYWHTYVNPNAPGCQASQEHIAAVASLAVDFTPGLGDAKGIVEAFVGKDLITGESLGNWRWLGLVGLSELRHTDEAVSGAFALTKYLRHADNTAFERLLSLGARQGDEAFRILNEAGSNTLIRTMTDRGGNSILLQAGNREKGLRHVLGRHFSGDISGSYTSYFSDRLKVGDVVDLIAQTTQYGDRTLGDHGNWVYQWCHDTWGWLNAVVNDAGEVISAFPE